MCASCAHRHRELFGGRGISGRGGEREKKEERDRRKEREKKKREKERKNRYDVMRIESNRVSEWVG